MTTRGVSGQAELATWLDLKQPGPSEKGLILKTLCWGAAPTVRNVFATQTGSPRQQLT